MQDDAEPTIPSAPAADDAADRHIRHERALELPVTEAWLLIASPEGLECWLGDEVDLTIEPGAEGTIRDGDELLLTEVESVEPERRVSLRWWSERRGGSVVDLTVEPIGDERCRLVVVEVPAEALRVPAVPVFGGGRAEAGPQASAGPRALAIA